MWLILLPAALYLFFHLLGWHYPALLWGVDQLHYYPLPVITFFLIAAGTPLFLAAKPSWSSHLAAIEERTIVRLTERFGSNLWIKFAAYLSLGAALQQIGDQAGATTALQEADRLQADR